MSATTEETPRTQAVAEAERMTGRLQQLEDDAAQARRELEDTDRDVGVIVVDDESAGRDLARRRAELRERIDLAERGATAARERLAAARSAALLAEAEELQPKVDEARAAVTEHQQEVKQVKDRLEELAGADFQQVTIEMLIDDAHARGKSAVGLTVQQPVVQKLREAASRLEQVQTALRMTAKGERAAESCPLLSWEDLPDSIRPGEACVREAVGWTHPGPPVDYWAQAADFERLAEELQEQIESLEEELARHPQISSTRDALHSRRIELVQAKERMHTARGRAERGMS